MLPAVAVELLPLPGLRVDEVLDPAHVPPHFRLERLTSGLRTPVRRRRQIDHARAARAARRPPTESPTSFQAAPPGRCWSGAVARKATRSARSSAVSALRVKIGAIVGNGTVFEHGREALRAAVLREGAGQVRPELTAAERTDARHRVAGEARRARRRRSARAP